MKRPVPLPDDDQCPDEWLDTFLAQPGEPPGPRCTRCRAVIVEPRFHLLVTTATMCQRCIDLIELSSADSKAERRRDGAIATAHRICAQEKRRARSRRAALTRVYICAWCFETFLSPTGRPRDYCDLHRKASQRR